MSVLSRLATVAAIAVALTSDAFAQQSNRRAPRQPQRSQYRPPTVTPYINLLRSNVDRRYLYQGVIRPQLDANTFRREQQARIDQLSSNVNTQRRTADDRFRAGEERFEALSRQLGLKRRETGHRTSFMDRSRYFPGIR